MINTASTDKNTHVVLYIYIYVVLNNAVKRLEKYSHMLLYYM